MQLESDKVSFFTAKRMADECYTEVNSRPDSITANQLLPLDDPSKATITQLASTARPTPGQMKKIIAYKNDIDHCDRQAATQLGNIDPGIPYMFLTSEENVDSIVDELSQGKIALGAATSAVQAEQMRLNTQWQSSLQATLASLRQENSAEMAQRQAAQAQSEANLAALAAQTQAISNQLSQGSQQMLQSTSNYQAPQPMPITPPGGNVVHCINTGVYTTCQ